MAEDLNVFFTASLTSGNICSSHNSILIARKPLTSIIYLPPEISIRNGTIQASYRRVPDALPPAALSFGGSDIPIILSNLLIPPMRYICHLTH